MRHYMFRITIQLSSNFLFYNIYMKTTLFPYTSFYLIGNAVANLQFLVLKCLDLHRVIF